VRKGIARGRRSLSQIAPIAALKALRHPYLTTVGGNISQLLVQHLAARGGGETPPRQPASCRRYSSQLFFWRMAARSSATISCEALMAAACWFTLNEIAPTRA
jgi:hypothetical protein